jgi:CDP-diacylglycerol--glycerol-3-phosphate 3-phosphatidyltransferase
MFRHVPNALTTLRLLLAVLFFVMLGYYQYEGHFGRHGDPMWLYIAFLLYVVALVTDFLDGYLARKWKVEGAFGRVLDPFVDKVLVLGSFIFFAGKNFTIPEFDPSSIPTNVKTITGVVPWMVVLILARELLVTSLRGITEAAGENFGAAFSGKLKMVLQSVTILVILVYVNNLPWLREHDFVQYATWFRNFCIWLMLAVTLFSGLLYVQRGVAIYVRSHHQKPQAFPPESQNG